MTAPIRVVVIDDEPDIRLLLKLQLEMEGFVVVATAQDGAEGVEACLTHLPDVAVIDLLMPVMTGFEAIAILQRQAPSISLVAYTGVAGDFVRTQMAEAGVTLALKAGDVKPLAATISELVAVRSR